MEAHVPSNGFPVRIGVAVAAEVAAGVVLADIICQVTGAFPAVSGIGRHNQILADRLFKGFLRDAAGAVRAGRGQAGILAAGLDDHTVPRGDGDDLFRQSQLGVKGDRAGLGKVSPDLFIEVNKADDTGMSKAVQLLTHGGKSLEMAVERPGPVDQDGIIAPAGVVRPDQVRETAEALHDSRLVRHIGLDVLPVGRDRHKPVLAVGLQQLLPLKEVRMTQGWLRIFCTENDQVDYGRVKPVARDGHRVKGIARHDIPLPQTVGKPLRIEGRDIGPVSGLNDHKYSLKAAVSHWGSHWVSHPCRTKWFFLQVRIPSRCMRPSSLDMLVRSRLR